MSTMSDLPAGYTIMPEGCTESYDDTGAVATLRFNVPASIKNRFLKVVSGLPVLYGYGPTGQYGNYRLVPLQHPDVYNCYASAIRGSAADGELLNASANGGLVFDWYIFDVTFTTPSYSYDGDNPLITVSRDVSSEMVTVPGTAYIFPSDKTYVKHDVGIPVGLVDYTLTFHRLSTLNNTLFDSLAGCVSSTPFMGADAGKTLYLGCSSTGEQTLGGQVSYEAIHQFQVRSVPFNEIMRPDGGGFEAPVQAGGGDNTYLIPTADLNQLYGV